MKFKSISFFAIGIASLLTTACTSVNSSSNQALMGHVRAVYVERAPYVFVDLRLAGEDSRGRLWADVDLDRPAPDGRMRARASLDRFATLSEGDRVVVTWSDRAGAQGPMHLPHTVALARKEAKETVAANLGEPMR